MKRESLLQGACYALDHCVRLLEDAAILYAAGSISSSFHLAVMAREELGRFNLLLEQSIELGDDGTIGVRELADRLKPHENKLRAGQSFVSVPMAPEVVARWTTAIAANDVATVTAISEEQRQRAKTIRKHDPSALHKRRLKAQYVDLNPEDGSWSKPSELKKSEARTLIHTVMCEIANALIAVQGNRLVLCAYEQTGQQKPEMGPFTHRVFGHLANGDVQPSLE